MENGPPTFWAIRRNTAPDLWLVTGLERYFAIQRTDRKTATDGLEVGFLACPAVEESQDLIVAGEGLEFFIFPWGEKAGGDIQRGRFWAYCFDVDADSGVENECERDPVPRVGKVEVERLGVQGADKSRFAELFVFESDFTGTHLEVSGQDSPSSAV